MADFVLFGTEGCHLCEEAETLLNEANIAFEHHDILECEEWHEKYGWLIPVLRHAESEQQLNWPFDNQKIQAFVDQCLDTGQDSWD